MPTISKQVVAPRKVAKPSANGKAGESVLDRIRPVKASKIGRLLFSIYGFPKTGKTRIACLFPKPILILGTQDGTASVTGTPGVDFVLLRSCEELREGIDIALSGKYATIVLDNGTGLRELRIKELWQTRGLPVPERKPFIYAGSEWKAVWVQCSYDLREMLSPLLDVPNRVEANVVVIAQEQDFSGDEGSSPTDGGLPIKPAIGSALGKSLSIWLNAECDYVCQTFIRQQEIKEPYKNTQGKVVPGKFESLLTGEKEFCLRVGPHETYVTGFRQAIGAPKLPDVIVDPTYEKIVELIQKK